MKVNCKMLWAITLATAICIVTSGYFQESQTAANVTEAGTANPLEDSVSVKESGETDSSPLESHREKCTALIVESDDVQTDISASLCSGPGYSLYLPDYWVKDALTQWHISHNEYIRLHIECFSPDINGFMDMQRCYNTITSEYTFDGVDQIDFWTELDNHTFQGGCSGSFVQVWLTEHGNDCWALFFVYPADAAESASFAAIASTFEPA